MRQYKFIKKALLFCIVCLNLGVFLSCADKDSGHECESVQVTDPIRPIGTVTDDSVESDYSNIVAVTEYEEYSTDATRIECTVTNNNVGKGFYLYRYPFIERLQDDEWVRVNFWTDGLLYESNWCFCSIEGNTTKPNSTKIVFLTEFLCEEFCPGDYRLVVFVGETKVYAPFKVVE